MCNSLHLPSRGSPTILAQRLFHHNNPHPALSLDNLTNVQIGDVTDQNVSITGFLNATYVATTAINVSPIQSRVSNLGQQNLINTVLPNQSLCAIAGTSIDHCVPSADPNPSSRVDIIRAEIRAVLP